MRTDTIFYQLFQSYPSLLFELVGLPPETAQGYQFTSAEIKELAFRFDGIFLPDTPHTLIPQPLLPHREKGSKFPLPLWERVRVRDLENFA